MAVVSVTERFRERKSSKDKTGKRSHTHSYYVVLDDIADGTAVALDADDGSTAIPSEGDVHPSGDGSKVSGVDAGPLQSLDMKFLVTVSYETLSGGTAEDPNPLLRPAQVSWTGNTSMEEYFTDTDGTQVVNSAGELYAAQPQREVTTPQVEITKNVSSDNPSQSVAYADAVNSGAFSLRGKTVSDGQAKMAFIGFSGPNVEAGVTYYVKKWVIKFNKAGWQHEIYDVGYSEIDGVGNLVAIKNEDGRQVAQPYPLDGSGSAKASPTSLPATNNYKPYVTKSFGIFSSQWL